MYLRTKREIKKAKKEYLERIIKRTYETIWDKEIRKNAVLEIREGIRKEYDKLVGRVKGSEDALVQLEAELAEAQKAVGLAHGKEVEKKRKEEKQAEEKVSLAKEMLEKMKKDSQVMKEQMMGKWSEKTQRYEAGIDQEVDVIKSQIDAGFLLIQEIKGQYDKL